MSGPVIPELHRPLRIDGLAPKGRKTAIATDAAERTRIAKRLALEALDRLEADTLARPTLGRSVLVEAAIRADYVQTCVITGEPIPGSLDIVVERRYSEDYTPPEIVGDEDEPASLDDDEPDPIIDGTIDLGEMVVEELALHLPEYPRLPGTAFDEMNFGPDGKLRPGSGENDSAAEDRKNPFSVLADLKKDMDSKG